MTRYKTLWMPSGTISPKTLSRTLTLTAAARWRAMSSLRIWPSLRLRRCPPPRGPPPRPPAPPAGPPGGPGPQCCRGFEADGPAAPAASGVGGPGSRAPLPWPWGALPSQSPHHPSQSPHHGGPQEPPNMGPRPQHGPQDADPRLRAAASQRFRLGNPQSMLGAMPTSMVGPGGQGMQGHPGMMSQGMQGHPGQMGGQGMMMSQQQMQMSGMTPQMQSQQQQM